MADMENSELWVSDSEEIDIDEEDEEERNLGEPIFIDLELGLRGQAGGFHVRNKAGEKQRPQVSAFGGRSKKRPAFRVSCTAKVMIHGTLDATNKRPATLLVYDFHFFSYRSTRIKSADIYFEFVALKGNTKIPVVEKIAPDSKNTIMQTTQKETRKVVSEVGVSGSVGATLDGKLNLEKAIEKETMHAAEITGDKPSDDWGNTFVAQWSLKENDSQKNGIVSELRTAILLVRENEEEFCCVPSVDAQPDFKTRLGNIGSSRTPNDPVFFDPEYEPYNTLEDGPIIDRWNLDAVDVEKLWDCTFQRTFSNAVK